MPFAAAGPLAAKLLKHGTLKVYQDLPHGMPTRQQRVNRASAKPAPPIEQIPQSIS